MKPGDIVPAGPGRARDLLPFLAGRPRHELEFLPAALEIIDTPAPPAARVIPAAICAFWAAAIAWSVIGRIDIVANAPGTIVPVGSRAVVQSRETATVASILVADGIHVVAGEAVIRLDPVADVAARDKSAADLARSRLDVAGLTALRDDLARKAGGRVSFTAPDGASPEAVAEEYASITARWAEQRAKLAELGQQLAEKRVEAGESAATVNKLRASLPMLAGVRDMYRELYAEQLGSRVDLLTHEQAWSEGVHDLAIELEHGGEADAEAGAIGREIEAQRADYANGVLSDLATARQKRAEAEAGYRAAAHEAADTVLRAPVTGTVQSLAVHGRDAVVTPGEQLMVVVPDGRRLVVDAVIANRDIGWVRAGQQVKVKIASFSFTRYGLIDGRVIGIDRDAVDDRPPGSDDGTPSAGAAPSGRSSAAEPDLDGGQGAGYVTRIALARDTVPVGDHLARLEPGMAVTAEVITGRRRVISYLLSPVMRYAQDAGRER